MSKYVPYKATDEELDQVARACLRAAHLALQPLKDEDLAGKNWTLACLRAFHAANGSARAEEKRLLAENPGFTSAYAFPEVTHIVCSALVSIDASNIEDTHPYSVAGLRLASLLQAAKALEGMASVYSAFDDDQEVFGAYMAEEAIAVGAAARA